METLNYTQNYTTKGILTDTKNYLKVIIFSPKPWFPTLGSPDLLGVERQGLELLKFSSCPQNYV